MEDFFFKLFYDYRFSYLIYLFFKISHVFLGGLTLYWPYPRNSWSNWRERGQEVHLLDRGSTIYVAMTIDLIYDFDLGFFKVRLWNSFVLGIAGLIDVKREVSKPVGYRADYATLPFDHTHDLGLGFSRSKFIDPI